VISQLGGVFRSCCIDPHHRAHRVDGSDPAWFFSGAWHRLVHCFTDPLNLLEQTVSIDLLFDLGKQGHIEFWTTEQYLIVSVGKVAWCLCALPERDIISLVTWVGPETFTGSAGACVGLINDQCCIEFVSEFSDLINYGWVQHGPSLPINGLKHNGGDVACLQSSSYLI